MQNAVKHIFFTLLLLGMLATVASARPKHRLAKKPGLVVSTARKILGLGETCAVKVPFNPQPKFRHQAVKARKKSKRQY